MRYHQNPGQQRERNQQILEENKQRNELFQKEKARKSRKKKIVAGCLIVTLLILSSLLAFYLTSPGKYDSFAQCLTEKGAIMYGENWCQYTNAQKNMFGKSFKYINYEVKENLRKRPTWVINGKSYETVQSFQRLSDLTGCQI